MAKIFFLNLKREIKRKEKLIPGIGFSGNNIKFLKHNRLVRIPPEVAFRWVVEKAPKTCLGINKIIKNLHNYDQWPNGRYVIVGGTFLDWVAIYKNRNRFLLCLILKKQKFK